MWSNFKRIALLAAVGAAQVAAQDEEPPALTPNATLYWEAQVIPEDPTMTPGIFYQNGVVATTSHVFATSVSGTVTAVDAWSGEFVWDYNPPTVGSAIARSHSKVAMDPAGMYMAYSVVDNENSATPSSRVIALDMDGNELWISEELDGIAEGTPAISSDGAYVFLTHNTETGTKGSFTVISAMDEGSVLYTGTNEDLPFSPVGIYHTPAEGYYGDDTGMGAFNTNDMLVWSAKPFPDEAPIAAGTTFGFQFPIGFGGNSSAIAMFPLRDGVDFKAITGPVLTNEGRSVYFPGTRSFYRGWTGSAGTVRFKFDQPPGAVFGFGRNSVIPGQSVFAPPAFSSDPAEPFVFGGTASEEFFKADFEFGNVLEITLPSIVKSVAAVDPSDRQVCYVEEAGVVHAANFDTLADAWTYTITATAVGDMAMHPNGQLIYVGDTAGLITCIQVSEIPVTESPSAGPTDIPSSSPTGPTAMPVMATLAPTVEGATPTTGAPSPTSAATQTSMWLATFIATAFFMIV